MEGTLEDVVVALGAGGEVVVTGVREVTTGTRKIKLLSKCCFVAWQFYNSFKTCF